MTFQFNEAGNGRALNENELYGLLTEHIYIFYDSVIKQYQFDTGCIIDFYCTELFTQKPTLIEVKNWFVTIKDIQQLIKYYVHAVELWGENNFSLIVYAGGIEPTRKKILKKLGIEVYLTKDLVNQCCKP